MAKSAWETSGRQEVRAGGMEATFDLKAEQLPWRSAEVAFLYLADVAEGEGEE